MDIDEFDSQPEAKKPPVPAASKPDHKDLKESEIKSDVKPVEIKRETPQLSMLDMTSGWETIKNNDSTLNQTVASVDFNNSELPLVQGEDGQQVFFFSPCDCYVIKKPFNPHYFLYLDPANVLVWRIWRPLYSTGHRLSFR